MLLVTGESRFADLLERTLYNGFLSGLSLDGESFFYSNPLQSRNGERRHRWNPVACCPPNVMRLLASLHHYLATVTETGVQLHQYASSTIRTAVPGAGPVELAVETGYPWSGTDRGRGRLEPGERSGRSRSGSRHGPGPRSSTASRSRRATTPR